MITKIVDGTEYVYTFERMTIWANPSDPQLLHWEAMFLVTEGGEPRWLHPVAGTGTPPPITELEAAL